MRSEVYFHEYLKYTKEAIADFNRDHNTPLDITSMTASNYYSLIIFLHASDLPPSVIHEEVLKLKSLIKINENIDREFDEFHWAKTNITKMR